MSAPAGNERGPVPGAGRRFWVGLLLIALAGLVFRVGYIASTRDDTSLCNNVLCGDALYYSGQANTLGLGFGWADFRDYHRQAADHPPLTAAVLSPLTRVFGGDPAPVTQQRLFMALVGAGVIVVVGLLGRRAGGTRGHRVGLIAAAIAAVYAALWMNDVLVMSETLAALGIGLVLLATYRFIDRPSLGRAAAIGALVGLATLARAELLLLLPITFLPVALWARSLGWWSRVARIALAGVVALAVLAPWTIMNLRRFDQPVFLSTNDGLTIVGANCDQVYGVDDPGGIGFWQLNCALALDSQLPPGADESVQSGVYRRAGIDYIVHHKRDLPKVEVIRLGRAWGVFGPDQMVWLNQGEGRARWASWTGYIQWWLLIIPAVAGAVILRRRREPVWPLASTAIIVTITVMAFYGIVRFRLPADLAAPVLAAVAIDAVVHRVRGPRPGSARPAEPARPSQPVSDPPPDSVAGDTGEPDLVRS